MTADYHTSSVGTKDWLRATENWTIRGFTEKDNAPLSNRAVTIALPGLPLFPWRIVPAPDSSIQTPLSQGLDYTNAPSSTRWSIHATEGEKRILRQLVQAKHESVAQRLSDLIDILNEDNEKIVYESLIGVAEFFVENSPKYPGPLIVCDDDGRIGIQWKIPPDQTSTEGKQKRGGILYIKVHSRYRVNCIGTLRSSEGAATIRINEVVSLDEIMDRIKTIKDRLDW